MQALATKFEESPTVPRLVHGTDIPVPELEVDDARPELTGAQALMLAVLEDGIRCYQDSTPHSRPRVRHAAAEARTWIESADASWLFAFETICAALNLDAESLRRAVLSPTANPIRYRRIHRVDHGRRKRRKKANAASG